jgi:formamidopyrimidine-DNA glycosylase
VRLHAAVIEALERSLVDGGTTFSDYLNGEGEPGLHRINVHVFRRDGEPCGRCGRTIQKIRLGGRGTHYCPRCQRR